MGKVFLSLSMSLDGYVAGPTTRWSRCTNGCSVATPPVSTATA